MTLPPAADFVIRAYRPSDRSAVRDICCRTACRNLGSDVLLNDAELFADYFTRYYTDFEPQSALVAEKDGRVVAYLTATRDTRRYLRTMSLRIMPMLLAKLAWRRLRGRYRRPQDRRFLRWLFLKSFREAPRVPTGRFPAHVHFNLLPEAYNQRLFSRMTMTAVDMLERAGCTHMHAIFPEPLERSVYARLVESYRSQKPDWILYRCEKPTAFNQDVLQRPEPMVNRVYGFALAEFRNYLEWVGRRYRL